MPFTIETRLELFISCTLTVSHLNSIIEFPLFVFKYNDL